MDEDDDILSLVRDERARSIGFEHDAELTNARQTSLEYFNGEVNDLDVIDGTSTAVSTDLADTIETVLPDLVEVFTTEEVGAFVPTSENDVAGAEQETDFVNHVILSDNGGFVLFSDMFRDALQLKVGVVIAQWVKPKAPETEHFTGAPQDIMAAIMASQTNGTIVKPLKDRGDGTIDYSITQKQAEGRVAIQVIPPEDFTVSPDTVKLSDSPYCAYRARVRRSSLRADGFDGDDLDRLPAYGDFGQNSVARERSQAGEYAPGTDSTNKETDLVEVVYHFVRQYRDDREVIVKVTTGADESVLLDEEEVNAIPFAAVTPYRITHRFYGGSMGDKLCEIQRINTQLLRLMLNAGYYAYNGRVEVNEGGMTAHTLKDLADARPGAPIRVKASDTVRPITNGGLSFQPMDAMEHVSVMSEKRSGVVRNAQGLNPDSLHETASGASMLYAAALKRIRYMARMFAETGVRDLYLLVHDLLRTHSSQARIVRMRGKYVPVDPSKWASRDTMSIEIGVGGGGRDHDLVMLGQVLTQQQEAVKAGGLQSGIVTLANIYHALTKFASRAGFKAPELFWSDPSAMPPQPPQPNPEVLKLQAMQQVEQAKLQLEQQKAQAESQHRDADRQSDASIKLQLAQLEAQVAVFKANTQVALGQEELRIKYGAQADQVAQEIDLKGSIAKMQADLEAAKLHMTDTHHVESTISDAMTNAHNQQMQLFGLQHTAGLQHVASIHATDARPDPKAITGGDVRPGGEPG